MIRSLPPNASLLKNILHCKPTEGTGETYDHFSRFIRSGTYQSHEEDKCTGVGRWHLEGSSYIISRIGGTVIRCGQCEELPQNWKKKKKLLRGLY